MLFSIQKTYTSHTKPAKKCGHQSGITSVWLLPLGDTTEKFTVTIHTYKISQILNSKKIMDNKQTHKICLSVKCL